MSAGDVYAIEGGDLIVSRAGGDGSSFPAIFLRDNCPCAQCRHANGQRLFEIGDIAGDVRVREVGRAGDALRILFSDGHESLYSLEWIEAHDPSARSRRQRRNAFTLWGAAISPHPPEGDWRAVAADPGSELAWLDAYHAHGFALLRNVPTRDGMVAEVGDRLGYVRVTNYGRLFDVISIPEPNNLAYTPIGLGVHSDNPYRDPTPGVQLLHCLEAAAPGGDTLLVDGFAAAQTLRAENPTHFQTLATVPATFRFADRTADLVARKPMISVDFDGAVTAVHYNNRSIAALDAPLEWIGPWYDAYRSFAAILIRPANVARFRLAPGDLIVMQNERALHGRTAFDPSLGRRHLQGCYIDKDALESRRRVLRRNLGGGAGRAA